ncbi:recombinase family protein [Oceanobacillus kapialis]|uniref:Recombinase family protein n=1 Tax=Oceanobacillus kapialis TaxID=481353 RepID=A0ABW5PXA3_9BACI
MKYGYARVSTVEQNLSYQLERLEEFGCDKIVSDKKTGINAKRKGLQGILSRLQEGDQLVILRIDRIARNVRDLLHMIDTIENMGAGLIILDMGGNTVDTKTPMGKFMVTMLGAVAEFEYDVNRSKQLEGIEHAKKQGKYKGRPRKYTDNNSKLTHALDLYKNSAKTVKEICEITGVGRTTLYDNIKKQGIRRQS